MKRGLCTGMHVCLYNLKLQDKAMIQGIYSLIIEDFAKNSDVHDDGISVVSAVAYAAQEHFGFLVGDFQKYLKAGLEKFQEKDVFKVSLDYISQLSKSCKAEFEPFITEIITPLIFCL